MPSYASPDFQVTIADYPYDPRLQRGEPRVVRRRTSAGEPLYYVYIRLEGPDLTLVKGARYFLHPSVTPSETYVDRNDSNSDCMIQLWLWGTFDVRATIVDIRGRTFEMRPYYLQFDRYFEHKMFNDLRLTIRDEGSISAA